VTRRKRVVVDLPIHRQQNATDDLLVDADADGEVVVEDAVVNALTGTAVLVSTIPTRNSIKDGAATKAIRN
jgi:hypothetical protein